MNRHAWLYYLAAAAVVAVTLGLLGTCGATPAPPGSPPPQQTFTWEGVTWDCGQVNAWDQQYGAYEPDGTPIPYEVVISCVGR